MGSIEKDIKDDIIKEGDKQSDLSKTSELLLNEKWRRRKTILRNRGISPLTTLDVLATIYDVPFLRMWVDSYTEYMTSDGGKGRQDIVEIAKYSIDKETTARKELLEVLGRR